MNLLYFTHEREYGGSSRALIALLKEIKKENNHNIYVVVPFKDAKVIKELEKFNINVITCFYSWWQIPIHVSKIKKILFKIAYLCNSFSEKMIIRKIKNLNIDMIHSNTSVIDMGARIANKLKIPHVWHFREFKNNNLIFIKGEKKSYAFINQFGGNIIYISKAIEEFYSKEISNTRTKLIYDGVSNDFIIKDKVYKENYNEIKFLLAGTLQESKGQHLAVEAVGILKEAGYKNIKLYLAGGDIYKYSNYLNTLIEKYNIEENVEYLGFVNDIKELRKKVDVELLCSESEAFGLVTVEGMMAGNLMIGSNSGATTEIIEDGITGYLYKCNDKNDLANKMKAVINDPSVIKKIGSKGQKDAIERFSSEKNALLVLEYYNKILKE